MTFLTAQEARTLAILNAHHHGAVIEENLNMILDNIRAAALQGHRETAIHNLKAEADLSELLEALKLLGYLGKSVRERDDTYVMKLCW